MTLLEIIQTICLELGLTSPSTLTSTTDPQVLQLMALANRSGTEMYRGYDWTDLQKEHIVNVEAATTTTGDITENSAVVTNIPDTTGLSTAYAISGNGQAAAQRIAEVLSSTSVRMEMLSTVTETGATLVFGKDTYDIPEDFDRYIGETWWDRSNLWMLIGPDSPQMNQYIKSGIYVTGPRRRWRQVGPRPQAWRIWPPPFAGGAPAPGALVWEYISQNWVLKADDTFASKMTENDDEPLLDPQLIILDTKWRMWQIKGFEYAAMQQEYVDALNAKFATDGGTPDLYLNRRSGPFLITGANVQDSNWPGSGNN